MSLLFYIILSLYLYTHLYFVFLLFAARISIAMPPIIISRGAATLIGRNYIIHKNKTIKSGLIENSNIKPKS